LSKSAGRSQPFEFFRESEAFEGHPGSTPAESLVPQEHIMSTSAALTTAAPVDRIRPIMHTSRSSRTAAISPGLSPPQRSLHGATQLRRWPPSLPGDTWQERWAVSGAEDLLRLAWADLPLRWLRKREPSPSHEHEDPACGDVHAGWQRSFRGSIGATAPVVGRLRPSHGADVSQWPVVTRPEADSRRMRPGRGRSWSGRCGRQGGPGRWPEK
jgi:hypothetical protein